LEKPGVPAQVPVLVPAPVPVPDNIEHNFPSKILFTKSWFFNVRSCIIYQKVGLSFLADFFIPFYVG
jgi:hypothetical protein